MAWGTKSRHERGYDYAWVKVRNEVMKRDHGLCQPCNRAGRTTLAHAVDHIVSKARAAAMSWTRAQTDHPSNLEATCEPCHLVKSEAEQGKTKRVQRKIGLDGFPI
jgi:5-methylcytosine-specific restriction protein A